jgi:hypothetical protein
VTGSMEAANTPCRQLTANDAVILVHGTFARDAPWTQEDSSLATAIRRKFPATRQVRFNWSGDNSPTARIKAGRELADLGRTLRTEGHQNIWIVSHSHGGNVALYSLRDSIMRSMVAGICFFGTPFFELKRRPLERFSAIVTQTVSWLLVFPIYMPFGGMLLMNWVEKLLGPIGGGFMLIFGNGLLVLLYLFLRPRIRRAAHNRLTAALKKAQTRALEWLGQPEPDCPTLVASISWDEAGLLLRLWDAVTIAPWQVFALAARLISAVVLGYLGGAFTAMFIYGDTVNELEADAVFLEVSVFLAMFVVLAPPLIALFVSLVRGSPMAFGYEGVVWGATLRITPTALPTWSQTVGSAHLNLVASPGLRGLRHSSFYGDAAVIEGTLGWMAGDKLAISRISSLNRNTLSLRRGQSGFRRWLLPGVTALAIILAQNWLIMRSIQKVAQPQLDLQPTSSAFWSIKPVRAIFKIDDDVTQPAKDFGVLTPPPVTTDPKISLPPGAHCLMEGEFTFGNWNTTINASLHDITDPHFGDFDFDMNVPNHMKLGEDFIVGGLHREIWEWYSPHGTTVSFQREFANRFARPAALLIRIWNGSSTPVHIAGQLRMVCLSGSHGPLSQMD